jgi:recombinational DNA repair protein RecR
MVINYSQHCSFVKAVEQTLDGAHPCDFCKRISKAKDAEKKQDNQRSTPKGDLICVVRQFALLPAFRPVAYSELASFLVGGSQQPPFPPPRVELA